MSSRSIVHRDVKPQNILWRIEETEGRKSYHFELGDLGLCCNAADAKSLAGTVIYRAPEKTQLTPKADIWSLYVTMLWALDINDFRKRERSLQTSDQVFDAVTVIEKSGQIEEYKAMGERDPKLRASAAQMLVKLFNAEGLSTHRNKVPDLPPAPRRSPRILRQGQTEQLGVSSMPDFLLAPTARLGTPDRWEAERE